MPKPPVSPHPLRDLRTAAGLTQPKLAEYLGVSRDTIVSIENHRLAMSRELALKTRFQFGCGLTHRTDKRCREHYAVTNRAVRTLRRYTKADFEEHRREMKIFNDENFEDFATAAGQCLDLLLRAARRAPSGAVRAICADFEQFVAGVFESYGLAAYLQALLREEWFPRNENLDIERTVRSFPLAPLSTAASFPISAPKKTPGQQRPATGEPKSRAKKVMPK